MENKSLTERRVKKRLVFTGGAVAFMADTVRLPNGKTAMREFMYHPGAVAVLPVLEDGSIILVRQYRYPVGKLTLELPAGKLHSRRDNPRRRAIAELREETGYTAGVLKPLLSFWPTPAFSNEILYIFLAGELKPGKPRPDEDEFLSTERLPFSKALRLMKSGEIKDAKTIIALQAYALMQRGSKKARRI